jgi:hypothetical protein
MMFEAIAEYLLGYAQEEEFHLALQKSSGRPKDSFGKCSFA